jgi:hypothetical protein
LVFSAPLREVEKVKLNKANSFDKIMVAIAIFALVGFCAALWKIVGCAPLQKPHKNHFFSDIRLMFQLVFLS